MRQIISLVSALLASVILAGCGGGGAGDQSSKVKFTSQVSFGDSLSDIGSYKVGTVEFLGGGQFTINGAGKNWIELMAAQVGLPAPCVAVTGGFGVPRSPATGSTIGCYGYAQGGARVATTPGYGFAGAAGPMTESVDTQVTNHLSKMGGSFTGSEVVYVLAGANDIFVEAGTSATAGQYVVGAATALVDIVNNRIIANGANYVVVVNIPDIANTPKIKGYGSAAQLSFGALVTAFNSTLKAGLANNAKVLLVDAYTVNHDQVINPAAYGLTNVNDMACDMTVPVQNPPTATPAGFGATSLVCNSSNVLPGVAVDHYMFADGVHPTPYGYLLLARLVSKEMLVKGWL